jgi:glycosyltransferase 2 family protein
MRDPSTSSGPDSLLGQRAGAGRRLLWTLKALVSTVLLIWILRRASLDEVLVALGDANLALVAAALGLAVGAWTISVSRWRILLASRAVRVPFLKTLRSHLSAIFFNNLLPSTVGGDTLRVYDSWRWGAGKAGAVAIVGLDRLLGMLALLIYAVVALLLAPRLAGQVPLLPLWVGLGAVGVLTLVGCALAPMPRVRAWLEPRLGLLPEPVRTPLVTFFSALAAFRDDRSAVNRALGLSLLLQLTAILHFYVIALALGLQVSLAAFFLVIPVSLAVMAIPLSVNAIGIRENVFAFFLAFYGVGAAEAVAFAWLSFGIVLFQGLLGGIVYAARAPSHTEPSRAA